MMCYNTNDPYTNLAHAVVIQAAEDYRNAKKGQCYEAKFGAIPNPTPEKVMKECTNFLASEKGELFTGGVNNEILDGLMKEE